MSEKEFVMEKVPNSLKPRPLVTQWMRTCFWATRHLDLCISGFPSCHSFPKTKRHHSHHRHRVQLHAIAGRFYKHLRGVGQFFQLVNPEGKVPCLPPFLWAIILGRVMIDVNFILKYYVKSLEKKKVKHPPQMPMFIPYQEKCGLLILKKSISPWLMSWLTTNFPWFSTGSLLPNLQALLPLLRHQRRLRCAVHRRCVIAGSGHGHQPSAWHQTSMEKHVAALQFIGPQQKHISRNESTISKKKANPNIFNVNQKQAT